MKWLRVLHSSFLVPCSIFARLLRRLPLASLSGRRLAMTSPPRNGSCTTPWSLRHCETPRSRGEAIPRNLFTLEIPSCMNHNNVQKLPARRGWSHSTVIVNKEQGMMNIERAPLHHSSFLVPCSIFKLVFKHSAYSFLTAHASPSGTLPTSMCEVTCKVLRSMTTT